ncbi:hypothetical protein BCR41DRAFT_85005 [Lobosporangium transversale]|uniref:Uncharacterized protein n=1 Tax=Lobosporangium transversale TaxID=64571 RepID=A0A1Y2GL56_9FUNG|nr:hypothetical protein BCR41DRAFT_85005 [Lobosporangium transversale]ORZ14342.1 hypothetical protein BCR41DRAFT_85005 [Lobosporangium transversale]|eukprot:XP_021880820.1 hypothetical protein BCR41DRAFT_85005 [Lobosporangium transversale]
MQEEISQLIVSMARLPPLQVQSQAASRVPSPKVICSALNYRIDLNVDGSDLFGPFTVEAKTQCSPLEAKVLLASRTQRLLGNFINFGGPLRVQLSNNFQGRVETRTHYGKIHLEEPEFVRLEGATLTIPSASDRIAPTLTACPQVHVAQLPHHSSNPFSSRTSSQGTAMSWGDDHHPHHYYDRDTQPKQLSQQIQYIEFHHHQPLSPESLNGSDSNSKAESTTGSIGEGRSVASNSRSERQRRKDEEKDWIITRELIGMIGEGPGLVMAKNSSGDISVELFRQ